MYIEDKKKLLRKLNRIRSRNPLDLWISYIVAEGGYDSCLCFDNSLNVTTQELVKKRQRRCTPVIRRLLLDMFYFHSLFYKETDMKIFKVNKSVYIASRSYRFC